DPGGFPSSGHRELFLKNSAMYASDMKSSVLPSSAARDGLPPGSALVIRHDSESLISASVQNGGKFSSKPNPYGLAMRRRYARRALVLVALM
ncbi:hypothetical protein ACFU6M_40645, partial [Streptomyces bottropensis]|uniref:hypothetical protein n=1 Tax=Streptomyces bottropensis TaxID=42235 RepID=UPI0036BFE014